MTVFIPGNMEHGVSNHGTEDFRWLYVFPGRFEDVVYRFRGEGEAEGGDGGVGEGLVKGKL